MKILVPSVLFFFFISCSEETNSQMLLKNYNILERAFQNLKSEKFKRIPLSAYEYHIDTKMLNQDILKEIQDIGILFVKQYKDGLFFITGETDLGNKGFFRSTVPLDSLKNHIALTHVKENWYIWFQD